MCMVTPLSNTGLLLLVLLLRHGGKLLLLSCMRILILLLLLLHLLLLPTDLLILWILHSCLICARLSSDKHSTIICAVREQSNWIFTIFIGS